MDDSLIDLIVRSDELADRCERVVPHSSGHAAAVARLRAAPDDEERAAAVVAARADGLSWPAIALVLGLTTADCRRRFDPPDPPRP